MMNMYSRLSRLCKYVFTAVYVCLVWRVEERVVCVCGRSVCMCRPTGSVIGPLHVGPVWLLTHFAYVLVSGASSGSQNTQMVAMQV